MIEQVENFKLDHLEELIINSLIKSEKEFLLNPFYEINRNLLFKESKSIWLIAGGWPRDKVNFFNLANRTKKQRY